MANPTLQKTFGELPAASADATLHQQAPPLVTSDTEAMTIGGTSAKTGFLLLLVVAAGAYGWTLVDPEGGTTTFPAWLWLVMIAALALAIVTAFRPEMAVFTGPIYALAQGVMVGAISHIYDAAWDGIVLQAILATSAVFIVMLVLFATRTIRVTNRMRGVIIGATFGIALFYLASILFAVFGVNIPLVWDSGPFGILFSVFVVGVAAFNLMLDFDLIERGVAARAPKHMEWYGAFGLMVTIIWMYIEMLRLLSKARN